jgi:hypothetical protein
MWTSAVAVSSLLATTHVSFTMRSSIQLPCRSHRGCTFHRHRNSSGPATSDTVPTYTTITATKNSGNRIERTSVLQQESLNLAPIQRLPTEILVQIAALLASIDNASFALTCRMTAVILGPLWREWSKAGGGSWYKHDEMLDLLERDLSDDYWRCHECLILHPRQKAMQRDGARTLGGAMLNEVLRLAKKEEQVVQFGPAHDPLYTLDFDLVKAFMDRHYLGLPHGVCYNTLRCTGTRTYVLSETSNMVLEYDFRPKIVVDRLLLQSTYVFRRQHTMFMQNVALEEVPLQEFFEKLAFWLCGHDQAAEVVQAFDKWSVGRKGYQKQDLKCAYCATQYSLQYNIKANPHNGIRIQSWTNLGSGKSLKDTRWSHFIKTGKRRTAYDLGKENVGEAFERIMCSTRKEFDRQLQRSDGGGSWYDPELKKRAYKTLPTTLAERL